MSYTNSSLVVYKKISPNSNTRTQKIDTITIHCMAGDLSVESCGAMFALSSRKASSNYGIGSDGRIALYVEEKNRSWCTDSRENDYRAVTIEVASSSKHPYTVSDAAYAALINLCVDICKRNNIKELKWKADKSLIGQVDKQNMTVHRWFKNKACPGDYLYNLHDEIAESVNKKLGSSTTATTTTSTATSNTSTLAAGAKLSLSNVALYASSTSSKVSSKKSGTFYIWSVNAVNGRVRITNSIANVGKSGAITGWITVSDAKKSIMSSSSVSSSSSTSFQVKVITGSLNIRKGAGTSYAITGKITNKGTYTIIETKGTVGKSGSWGKLKSGVGWISLNSCYVKKV